MNKKKPKTTNLKQRKQHNLNIKKTHIIMVVHTHWDREWYFTEQVSKILLERMRNDIIHAKSRFHFHLDGQASLFDDISTGKNRETWLTKRKLVAGPLYVQQDTLNVMFGTTMTNVELGKKVIGLHAPKTVYMPDSFGFNEQLPQIFKHYGFKNFVAWRGIKVDEIKKSNLFQWKGIDGTKIKTSYMSEGYFCLGTYYPYNNEKGNEGYEEFVDQTYEYIRRLEKKDKRNVYWLPVGGDEAPFERDIVHAVKLFNKKYKKYHMTIGTHDEYFRKVHSKTKEHVVDYQLYYSGVSKIHRTIHSNRYDIKRSFRDAERRLYYVMEPLGIMYKKMGGSLLSMSFKENFIYKPLLRSSAHDSLGAANLDETNSQILNRNLGIYNFINSYIDQIKRDIKENLKLKKDEYLIFNLAPFKRRVAFFDVVSTNNNDKIYSSCGSVIEYKQTDVSIDDGNKIINHSISVNTCEEMEPLSFKVIQLEMMPHLPKVEKIEAKLKFKIEIDGGDEFDFSYTKIRDTKFIEKFVHVKSRGNENHKFSLYTIPELEARLWIFNNNFGKEYKIAINNKFKNTRVALEFPKKAAKIKLSRHLALIEQHIDAMTNWKELGYKDMPLDSYTNDGLIVNGKQNILTKGNNEVFIRDKTIELTLYRAVGYLGKPDLLTRPGVASGIEVNCKLNDSQLQKELKFNFAINEGDPIAFLNSWNFRGIGQFASDTNLILNQISRFVWNNRKLDLKAKINFRKLNISKHLVGRFRPNKNKEFEIVYTNQKAKIPERIIYEKRKIQ